VERSLQVAAIEAALMAGTMLGTREEWVAGRAIEAFQVGAARCDCLAHPDFHLWGA
jgi:hypothetical protein